MMNTYDFLQQRFLGNAIESYLWFGGILLAGILFKRIISSLFSRLLFACFGRKTRAVGVEKFLELLTQPLSVFVLVITFYLAFDRLVFPQEWQIDPQNVFGIRMIIFRLFDVAIILSIAWVILRLTDFVARVFLYKASLTESKMDDQLVLFTREVVKVILAIVCLFAAIAVGFNLDVVSLVTGLGIGGLAFALAAKETLENLLGSFTIFLDKPFKVGDQIRVGGVEGIVESVGIRTTRLRSLNKSLVILPNKKMIDAELVNEDERVLRRVRFTIGLTYGTSTENILKISAEIRSLLHNHPLVSEKVNVHFRDFSSSSLDILVNYFITNPDYEKYLEINEEINLAIMNIVEKNGCSFAFPSTSVYLERIPAQNKSEV
ncbi:MAG: mechanosensitive ion channel family protein [Bacteroidota bacterium]